MTTGKSSVLLLVADTGFFFSHRIGLARDARSAGYGISVAAPAAAKTLQSSGFRGLDWQIDAGGMNPLKEMFSISSLCRLIAHERPALVHAIGLRTIVPAAVASLLFPSIPLLCLFTGLGFVFTANSAKARLVRVLLKPVLKICFRKKKLRLVFQNPDDLRLLVDQGYAAEEKTALIRGSGVDTEEYAPQPEPQEETIVVTMPARLLGDKGAREFIAAAGLARARDSRLRFRIAGGRDPKNPSCLSEQEIAAAQERGDVTFLGHRNDMADIYAQSHIVCLPSYREGLPRALIEAAACGRPLVATDVPGCREIVAHGKNGLLTPVRDTVSLAETLLALAGDAEKRRRFADAGRKMAEEEFSLARVNRETLELYAQLLREEAPVK